MAGSPAAGCAGGINDANMYDVDPHVAEIYDQVENYETDVDLLRSLIAPATAQRILEPFCGTGRIAIPLACDGHRLVGLDQAEGMLDRARMKVQALPSATQARIVWQRMDVLAQPWPVAFDVVILGGNCLYELATPIEQERCIELAAWSLKAGGWLYVDNDHMEGVLAVAWREQGKHTGFPTGICQDGTRLTTTVEPVWFHINRRLIRYRRCTRVVLASGAVVAQEYTRQVHPVSTGEVEGWLAAHGFEILRMFGDRAGGPYSTRSERAIFWARRRSR